MSEFIIPRPGDPDYPAWKSPELHAALAARDALKIGPTIYKKL